LGRFVSTFVPGPLQHPALVCVNTSIRLLRKIMYFGGTYYCPVCGSRLRTFVPLVEPGYISLGNKRCPICKSLERHRWVWRYLNEKTNLMDGRQKKMLHIAPERELSGLFQRIPGLEYLSGDLAPGWAMEQMDITDIHYPDQTFDVIYCSHVLEHVPEDRKAIAEFYRVLKPGGWALIIVPINRERTYEDLSVTGPEERRKIFGHPEHVRHCGQDYAGRLRSSGFHVTTEKPSDYFDQKQFKKYGLKEEPLFFCEKK
jgi:SAM-dependent methyltransferase